MKRKKYETPTKAITNMSDEEFDDYIESLYDNFMDKFYSEEGFKLKSVKIKPKNIYVAGPWFSERQYKLMKYFYNVVCILADSQENCSFYFPMEHNEDSPANVFDSNLNAIDDADIVLVLPSTKDSGTAMETGYALASDKKIIAVVASMEDFKSKTNIMMSYCYDNIITFEELPAVILLGFENLVQKTVDDTWEGKE